VFTGNHDRLLGPYLEEEIGARVCRAPECRVLKGRTCYIGHGDDRAGATGRLAESPIIRRAVAAVHPDLGVRLIERTLAWRRRSPTVDTGAADRDESAAWDADVLRLVQAHPDVDCFVTGHRHRPQLVRVDDRVTYVDVGDWVTHQSFAVLDPQALRLETFDG
jgi:UDP-2,3-diacylglucosamine hydrolase